MRRSGPRQGKKGTSSPRHVNFVEDLAAARSHFQFLHFREVYHFKIAPPARRAQSACRPRPSAQLRKPARQSEIHSPSAKNSSLSIPRRAGHKAPGPRAPRQPNRRRPLLLISARTKPLTGRPPPEAKHCSHGGVRDQPGKLGEDEARLRGAPPACLWPPPFGLGTSVRGSDASWHACPALCSMPPHQQHIYRQPQHLGRRPTRMGAGSLTPMSFTSSWGPTWARGFPPPPSASCSCASTPTAAAPSTGR